MDDLTMATETELVDLLITSPMRLATPPKGFGYPRYSEDDIKASREQRGAVLAEFSRRGYSGDEVERIKSHDWAVLDGRGADG